MFYMKFTEHNEHEGETWVFWLSIAGNTTELGKLEKLIGESFDEYELNFNTVLNEDEVDTLCEHGGQGYMDYHNKVDGKFTCPDEWEDLYKGGIKDCFEPHN